MLDMFETLVPHFKPKKQGYLPKAKAIAVQLVQEPDFYEVAGQDHHTACGTIHTASIAGLGKIGTGLKLHNAEDHSSEVCPPTGTNSSESNVEQYMLPNRST
ncbi:hypothetical protein Ddye_013864 [Dipteronia dyeriana]|uniref:Uncharacterized protein n=1 Tax=Dipteronia dyeriana TaxID=168575 RepID=A0AAD9X7F0_9ROSI|nr:hypothetical protein Ddye_013864 [Dipteronia dyeriana]